MLYDSIDDKNLNSSLWILKNISKIRFFIKFSLVAIIVALYSIFIFNIYIIIQSSDQYVKLYDGFLNKDLKNYSFFDSYLKQVAPIDLSLKIQGVSSGYSRIYDDFYALVSNPNKDYKLSYLEYYFTYNGDKKTPIKNDYIGLESDKYLFIKGVQNVDGEIKDPKFVVQNLRWVLVDKNPKKPTHFVDTMVPYDCEFQKNNIVVSGEKINNTRDNNGSVNVFNFTVTNNSLNNYNTINAKIVFSDKSNKVNYVFEKEIYQLRSNQSKNLEVNLPSSLQDFGNVLVLPEVDMCVEDSYMPKDIINTGV